MVVMGAFPCDPLENGDATLREGQAGASRPAVWRVAGGLLLWQRKAAAQQ
jgi:hypothetical protein